MLNYLYKRLSVNLQGPYKKIIVLSQRNSNALDELKGKARLGLKINSTKKLLKTRKRFLQGLFIS